MFTTPGNQKEDLSDASVLHIDDIAESFATELTLGRKGLSLYKLHSFDVPIPEFFVISPNIFSEFIRKILDEKKDELLKEKNPEPRDILNIFHRYDFDDDLKREILKDYTRLSGFSDAWVSVRSSVCAPMYNEVSFSDVFATELNVRGFNNLLKSIKSVYASLFTDNAVMYAVREGVELADVKLAVVVQKMVHSEVSGTCFTLDPVTLSTENLSIEAVYGLGDVIANGEITPDTYQLSKKNLEVLEKHISPQEWMKIRSLNMQKDGFEKITISPAWSHKQKLEDKYIEEVSKISMLIEDKVGESVDVEWALSSGRIYIFQYKPAYAKQSYLSHHIQFGGYSYVANSVGQVITEFINRKELGEKIVQNSMHEAQMLVTKEAVSTQVESTEEKKEEERQPVVESIASGIGVSFGQVKGVVKVIKSPLDEVSKNDIILLNEYNPTLSPALLRSNGVICSQGGLTSELSILCREFGIPAIVGVGDISEKINPGDTIEMDGTSGAIYMIDRAKMENIEVARDIASKQTEVQFVTAKSESRMDGQELSADIKTATKIYVDGSNSEFVQFSDGVVFVDLDRIILNFGKHPYDVIEKKEYKKYSQEVITPIVSLASAYSPNEVVLVIGKSTSNEFSKIAKTDKSENSQSGGNTKGAARYLENKRCLDVAVRLVRRIRNIHGLRNVSIGVYQPQNGTYMKEIKKEISARGLRRGSSFNIFAVIENPAEIILCDDILDAEIDGIIVDTSTLARHVFNLPMNSKDVVYDLSSNSILRIIDAISLSVKKRDKRLIVFVEDNKDLVKYCISKGVFGIVVPPKYIATAKKLVSEQEAKIILSVM